MSNSSRQFPLLDGHFPSSEIPNYPSRWQTITFGGPIIGALGFVLFLGWRQQATISEIAWPNVAFVFFTVSAIGVVPAAIAATIWYFMNHQRRRRWVRFLLAIAIGGMSALVFGAIAMKLIFGFFGSPTQLAVLFGMGALSLTLTALPGAKAREPSS